MVKLLSLWAHTVTDTQLGVGQQRVGPDSGPSSDTQPLGKMGMDLDSEFQKFPPSLKLSASLAVKVSRSGEK